MRAGPLLAAAALCGPLAAAPAEERRLDEADIRKVIPVLRAEGAAVLGARGAAERPSGARAFRGDPLAFLRERAGFDPPKGAKYEADCSRAASFAGPQAIFTFGRSIDCHRQALRAQARTGREQVVAEACQAEGERADRFVDGLGEGLERRGFRVSQASQSGRTMESGDGRLRVSIHPHNVYDRANRPDDHPLRLAAAMQADEGVAPPAGALEAVLSACSAIPSGPLLVVAPGSRFDGEDGGGALTEALRKAGLGEVEYQALKESLFLARLDAQQDLLAGLVSESDPGAAVRRSNAELFRRHSAALTPLLDALVPGGGSR